MPTFNSNPLVIHRLTCAVLLFIALLGLLDINCEAARSSSGSAVSSRRSCGCSPSETDAIIASWARVRRGYSSRGHVYIFQSMVEEMEKQDQALAAEMRKILDRSSAPRLMVKVELYLHLLRRPDALRAQLRHDIRRNPAWALKAKTLILRAGLAVDKVLTKVLDINSLIWKTCISHLARTVMKTIAVTTLEAKCRILNDTGEPAHNIEGNIRFSKLIGGMTTVNLDIRGFNSTAGTQHAFHIHKIGQTGNRCSDAGSHFNPTDKDHGAPDDDERHVGDLGNVVVDGRGRVVSEMKDRLLELSGENNIIGKSVVVHAGVDDLGRGGFPDSKTTGHAGGRIGCCVIEEL